MRSATSCRLTVRSSSSSASSFLRPSAEIGTGRSGFIRVPPKARSGEKKNTEGRLGPQRPAAYGGCVRESYTVSAPLLRHYRSTARDLPWRRTRDPYAILVSEVMLQQTQAARVVPAYRRFLARFPSLRTLAAAPLGAVLREWSGLGYNRRARDLHRIARASPDGLPRTVEALDAFPGIGAYTAGAVACFAFGARVPFADTNIRRVLGRVFLGRVATEREARALDERHMPTDAVAWHHALIDLRPAASCAAQRRTPTARPSPIGRIVASSAACRTNAALNSRNAWVSSGRSS